jgi:hypothetical protein
VSSSVVTNPGNAQVIVDTGPLVAGSYLFGVNGAATNTWTYDIKWMDVTNTATNQFVRRIPAAGNDDWLAPNKITIASNERLRVVCVGTPTADVQLSIFYMEVAT